MREALDQLFLKSRDSRKWETKPYSHDLKWWTIFFYLFIVLFIIYMVSLGEAESFEMAINGVLVLVALVIKMLVLGQSPFFMALADYDMSENPEETYVIREDFLDIYKKDEGLIDSINLWDVRSCSPVSKQLDYNLKDEVGIVSLVFKDKSQPVLRLTNILDYKSLAQRINKNLELISKAQIEIKMPERIVKRNK